MGKSGSCFKLITCGGGSGEKDGYEVVSEIKDSNDKSGWSFRKRSARHRVLSNTVITETPTSANKESSECTSINFQALAEPDVVEKVCTTNFSDEKPQLSSLASSQMPEMVVTETESMTETESKVEVNQLESVVIVIQTAIRGFLAQRALLKSKNVVKLQAVVRGHLVRRHAVGTLRCVQAIVKMQVLVRARRAQQSHSESYSNRADGIDDCSKTLGNEHLVTKSNVASTSIEKLLRNRFARQLLESTPKYKPIHVKCDPSKADSAWKWLERWMSVSSADPAEQKKPICMSEQSDETKESSSVSQLETGVPTEVFIQSANLKPTVKDPPLPSEDEEKMTSYDANKFNLQESLFTSSHAKDNLEQASPEKMITHDAKVTSTGIDSVQNEKMESHDAKVISTEIDSFQNEKMESDASAPQEPSSLSQKPEIDGEQCKQSLKRSASDELETEGKKFVHGSRKTSNPAFIAAQSKFAKPSSLANSGRSSSLSNQDAPVESKVDTSSVATDTTYRSKEFSSENPVTYPSVIGGSECGTELSVSSTLDSPDRSEVGAMESEHVAKDLVEGIANPESKIDHGVEANVLCTTPISNIPNSDLNQLEFVDDISGNVIHSVEVRDSTEQAVESEKNASNLLREQKEAVRDSAEHAVESEKYASNLLREQKEAVWDSTEHAVVSQKNASNLLREQKEVVLHIKSSPEASPRSQQYQQGTPSSQVSMTIPESQGTPSSQVSVKPKESKINKTGSSNRRRILSVGNKSPASGNHDSGSRGSREQPPKDQQSGKRRNSFGSVKSDHIDQEPTDDTSNNSSSLPRFMQATESARAKINANNSPRSSPDVHDQDIHIKKRHSLPGSTGRQGSPRVQQGTKGNGAHALHEKKWQR